jgi:alpha-galactosidase
MVSSHFSHLGPLPWHSRQLTDAFLAAVANGRAISLNGKGVSYRFRVDEATGDLISSHFGGPVTEDPIAENSSNGGGWSTKEHLRREYPDLGRGDFRSPAISIQHSEGHTVSSFKYESHHIINGKPDLPGLPSTFGEADTVTTLVVRMCDVVGAVEVDLTYSVFPEHDAIVRSATVRNLGNKSITINKLASFSVDLPYHEYEMLQLQGEWVRECTRIRRKVDYGTQGSVSSKHNTTFRSSLRC